MIERIFSFAALVVRALQVTIERSEMKEQTQKLRDWQKAAPVGDIYVAAPAKAFVTRSGR